MMMNVRLISNHIIRLIYVFVRHICIMCMIVIRTTFSSAPGTAGHASAVEALAAAGADLAHSFEHEELGAACTALHCAAEVRPLPALSSPLPSLSF